MRADRDDMPDYLQPRNHAGGAIRWTVAGILGVGVTAGILYIAAENLNGKVHSLAMQKQSQPAPVPRKLFIPTESVRGTDWDQVVEEQTRRDAEPQPERPTKQTSFNDLNYIPRGADNVVPAEKIYTERAPEQRKQEPKKIVVVGKAERRLSDYCPYKEGSVERRNCKQSMNLISR